MVKRLVAVGNSLGLVIPKAVLDLLKIDRSTELEVTTDGEALIIRPMRPAEETARAPAEQASARPLPADIPRTPAAVIRQYCAEEVDIDTVLASTGKRPGLSVEEALANLRRAESDKKQERE
jgi:antitoxin MazE